MTRPIVRDKRELLIAIALWTFSLNNWGIPLMDLQLQQRVEAIMMTALFTVVQQSWSIINFITSTEAEAFACG